MHSYASKLLYKTQAVVVRKSRSNKVLESSKTCLIAFSEYLQKTVNKHIKDKRRMNKQVLVDGLFNGKSPNLDKYCQYHLWVCNECFQQLVKQILKEDTSIKPKTFRTFSGLICEYLYDVREFIEYFERKENPTFVLFESWKSYHNSSAELERISHGLYWNATFKENILDTKMSINLSVFTLRQALEIKAKRICSVYDIVNQDGKPLKMDHYFFFDFIKEQKNYIKFKGVDLTIITKIFKWTNNTIHNAANPRVWELKFALDTIVPFFRTESHKSNGRVIKSIYGAVTIQNLDELKLELEKKLQSKFRDESSIEVIWTNPEALIVND